MDAFTGRILDTLSELGVADDTIVVWASDNGADPNWRTPAADPDPLGQMWAGSSGPWRGGYFTSLEGSNRTPCIIRWPGKVPAGKVSNELVHEVDLFSTLVSAGGATVPTDRQIDGMDMQHFLLGDAEESGRDTVLCIQGNRLQAVKWHQWKIHLFQQDEFMSTWTPYNMPHLYNLEWDPREENQCTFAHGWVAHPAAAAVLAFFKTMAIEPPIKPGTPDPYTPPKAGDMAPEEHLQIGPITQYVTALSRTHNELPDPPHGLEHATG
jgi:arylsulfatase